MLTRIVLNVNRKEYPVEVAPDDLLVDVLREKLGLTGTKKGCSTGDCGACTVIMDGRAVTSCMILAVSAEGKAIITIEGLQADGQLHPIQQSFLDHHAVQCGYCTPGMVLSAKALLDENPNPSEDEIRQAISGNLCRCTGYQKIVEAVQAVSATTEGGD
jgi:aerobic-type carbon monoxide dehydrogenase small subunit (CoxS/CutS family)